MQEKQTDIIELLLAQPWIEVNAANADGITPLMEVMRNSGGELEDEDDDEVMLLLGHRYKFFIA